MFSEAQYTVEGNEGDRNDLKAWHSGVSVQHRNVETLSSATRAYILAASQDDFVQKVAAVCNNTIVIVESVGPIIMEPWVQNPNGTPCPPLLTAKY